MNFIKRALRAMRPEFLGGEVLRSSDVVEGEFAMGITADLQKASGGIQVHRVLGSDPEPIVTLELVAHDVPGDSPELACVQLTAEKAERLASELLNAARSSSSSSEK